MGQIFRQRTAHGSRSELWSTVTSQNENCSAMAKSVMIHVRVPAEVVKEIDGLRGDETREAIVTEALRAYMYRPPQLQAVRTGKGMLANDLPRQ